MTSTLATRATGVAGTVSVRVSAVFDRVAGWRLTAHHAVLATALVAGAAVRLVGLGAVGLNSDEAVYAAQSASLAGNPHFSGLFPIVRAHPLVLQVVMSPLYRHGVPDTAGRYVAALFGLGTVALVYVLGRVLYGPMAGSVAALLLAVMPYHVVISRQIILDGPMTFFATATMVCLALAARTEERRWLLSAGACLGLAALSKETAIILVGPAFVFLSLANRLLRPLRLSITAGALALGIAWSYPLLTALSGGTRGGQSYLMWQLTRRPNHSFGFYVVDVGSAIGVALFAVAAVGLMSRRLSGRGFTWRETLLLAWVAVPFLFFQVWPVKGFSYLLPVAPAVAVLAARAVCPPDGSASTRRRRVLSVIAAGVCAVSLAVPSVRGLVSPATSGLAAAGGLPGGREVGRWAAANAPEGAQFMTIGPSLANVIQYYSGRPSDGLSVSPNPLHRNPSYHPIVNADVALRSGTYQYVVWDVYSARRSPQFGARALQLVRRFHGQVVHVERGRFAGKDNQDLIVVYKVTP